MEQQLVCGLMATALQIILGCRGIPVNSGGL
jgi:hypothetical protein